MAILYKYFILNALPELWLKLFHKEIVLEIGFVELVFFGMLMGIGPNILMYVGAMGGISESLSESAQLDGCGLIQEFWYITLPCVYPTLVTFLVVGLVNIFTNQLNLYNFYQGSANTNLYTFGYYLFRGAQRAQSVAEYPVLAAMGIIFTIVIVPVTLLFRKLLVKFGPSAD
jgi:ABC-type glycerol-3-phosphate transport system permease component